MLVEELKNSTEWESFLENFPDSTFYHSLKWRDIIQQSFSYSPLYLIIRDTSGIVVGICPGFITRSFGLGMYNSMPHSDYGGPLIARRCLTEASISLKNYLKSLRSRKGILYARFCLTEPAVQSLFTSRFGHYDMCTGVVRIDLKKTPSDFLWNTIFSGNRRRKMRLVERKGFEAWEASSKSDLQEFYKLYWDNMKSIGADPYPYRFMQKLWDFLYPDYLALWLAGRKKVSAGVLFLKHKQESFAAYAGIDRAQRVHGLINYLWWKELLKAENERRRYVSLGSTPSDLNHHYHVQKMSMGGSFHQQKIVWYPVSLRGSIISQTRDKTITTWRKIRGSLPTDFRQLIESRLEGM